MRSLGHSQEASIFKLLQTNNDQWHKFSSVGSGQFSAQERRNTLSST